ncbi:MAG: O-methyltransferase [Bacteroides sp.]|nr:O-methyltransferase [Bacteroides sp.]
MQDQIDQYIAEHISAEPKILADTYRYTHLHHLYPRMCSGHIQGRILKMLTSMIRPERVLELGAYTGYSALCMAEAMTPGTELHTVELDDELEDELRERFASSLQADIIRLHIGDCLQLIDPLSREHGPWDMVFMDANKRHYPQYLEALLPHIRPGGYILADNTLWDGKVAQTPAPTDPQSVGIMQFNDMVAADPRLEVAILPLRDGLTLIRVME